MSDGRIPNDSITASSFSARGDHFFCLAKNARLLTGTGWCAQASKMTNLGSEYLQVDLGVVKNITKVATQGRYNVNQWVTQYSLSYSNDAASWIKYTGSAALSEAKVTCK